MEDSTMWWVKLVSFLIVTFPAADVMSAFPLFGMHIFKKTIKEKKKLFFAQKKTFEKQSQKTKNKNEKSNNTRFKFIDNVIIDRKCKKKKI